MGNLDEISSFVANTSYVSDYLQKENYNYVFLIWIIRFETVILALI